MDKPNMKKYQNARDYAGFYFHARKHVSLSRFDYVASWNLIDYTWCNRR